MSLWLKPNRQLIQLKESKNSLRVVVQHNDIGNREEYEVDIVILATGYCYQQPDCLNPILKYIKIDNNEPLINDDFSICWDGPVKNRIYVQNWSISQRGVADPNLSLMPWRSAKIINSMMGKTIYETESYSSMVTWE